MGLCECKNIPTYWTASAKDASTVSPFDIINNHLEKKEENIQSGYSETQYECLNCHTRYLLLEDAGYHYPVYTFKQLNK
jgi:hypothetical protein